jgi:hypothetical protein
MTSLTKPLREGETKILHALKDGKLMKNSELKATTGLSGPSLSDNLKMLQKRKMVKRDIDSRKYVICSEGLHWLRRDGFVDTIKSGSLNEERLTSPPVDSIVAIDIPNMPEALRRVLMAGTPDIAKACFNQCISDTRKAKGSECYPAAGRIVYTAAIDWSQVQPWLTSEEGKKYLKMLDKEKESSR